MNNRQIIAIPMGDAAGIGPEIAVKSLTNKEIYDVCKPVIVGDLDVIQKAVNITKSDVEINNIDNPENGIYKLGTIDVIDLNNIDAENLKYGEVSAKCGEAAYEYIKKSVELAMDKKVSALAQRQLIKNL